MTHPLIQDGWFREINDQWPGQAYTLKVKRVLHTEKSKFQDVLVFESENHGNVLVLDGVIQCVEHDEFSYQEMIAHVPLSTHPNPENVLVIGGGDGGVLREVVKHPSVKKAVLCDIDEAVPRVSKDFLPHMSAGFKDPRVSVHIGDGFQFLKDYKNEFDVIITDSSDPVGPAKSLFEKPYFQLLYESLRAGGTVSTQAENFWIHTDFIGQLLVDISPIFPKVEYAHTSIPSYPSGGIGFLIATKDQDRDLRLPLRAPHPTRYWTPQAHAASFVLPAFAQKVVDAGRRGILVTQAGSKIPQEAVKKVLILGSGFVANPAAEYVLRRPENQLTVASRTLKNAQAFVDGLSRPATALQLDIDNKDALESAIAAHDLVVSLVPYTYHATVIEAAIKHKTDVVTTSYVNDNMRALAKKAEDAGITVLNEIGLDPGIDHLYAVKAISDVHAEGGDVTGFVSFCGGLPAPENANNPLGYKFSWSSRGVLLALLNNAKFYEGGNTVSAAGNDLMKLAKPYFVQPGFGLVGYPNRDSTPFREFYNIPEASTVVRGTLRFEGFPEFIKVLVDIGFLDASPKDYVSPANPALPWAQVTQKALGASDASKEALVDKISSLASFKSEADKERILAGLGWIGIFSDELVTPRGSLLDTLCASLEKKMQYGPGERDLVILQHKFFVTLKDGSKQVRTSTLIDFGAPIGSGGPTSMAKLVGVPCGVAIQLVLDGKIPKKGVLAPYTRDIVDPLLEGIEKEGIKLVERIL